VLVVSEYLRFTIDRNLAVSAVMASDPEKIGLSAGPVNKRIPDPPEALHEVTITPLKVFLRLFDTNGVAKVPLRDLISTVYPSYKLKFLSSLIARYANKRKVPRGQTPTKLINVSLELVYFRTPKPKICPGVTPELLVNFFASFFRQDDQTAEDNFRAKVKQMVESPDSSVAAVVLESEVRGIYHIIACVIWYHEESAGNFIPLVAVLDRTTGPGSLPISSKTFKLGKDQSLITMLPEEADARSFQCLDVCKFLFSLVQLVGALGKRGSTFPTETLDLQTASTGYRRHHIYLQSRVEFGSKGYSLYVTYGFHGHQVSRSSFMCWNYQDEIPVWPSFKKKKKESKPRVHSSDYGVGYYLDDCTLRRVCLNRYMLNTCPPKESSLEMTPPPFCRFSSCVIPLPRSLDLFRETADVYLHLKHFAEMYHKQPLQRNRNQETGLHMLAANPFASLLEENTPTDDTEWKIVLSLVLVETADVAQSLPTDPRSTLLTGMQLIHNSKGTMLLEVAQVLYQTMYRYEVDVPEEALSNELTWSAEEFSVELGLNLAGFYYKMSRCPTWNDAIRNLATLVASEYKLRVHEEDSGVYELEEGEFIDTLDSSIVTGLNWDKTFYYLGRRYEKKMPATLWVDLFALGMMYNEFDEVRVLFLPCYAEMKLGQEEAVDQYRLSACSPGSISKLEPIPPRFQAGSVLTYTVIPVYMYDHNPHLLRSVESVYPLFYTKVTEDFISELNVDLRLEGSAVMDVTLDEPRVDWRELMLYEAESSTNEDMKRVAYIKKKKKDSDDAEAEKKKAAKDALDKEEEDEKERKKHEDENTVWYKKRKKLFARKVANATNDDWLLADGDVDESNPLYMYADLGDPWNDRYLEHEEPDPQNYWDAIDEDLPEDFEPDEDHIFNQEEIDGLADCATAAEKKEKSWALIVQAACSMKSNIGLLDLEDDDGYTDQEYIDLACLLDPGRELKCDRFQKKLANKLELQVKSYELPGRLILGSTKQKHPVIEDQCIIVYKDWLREYLGYYNPGYYDFLVTSVYGTEVEVLKTGLASANENDYQNGSLKLRYDDVVPFNKTHAATFLDQSFVRKYAANSTKSSRSKHRHFKHEYEKECNPSVKFDPVPFPKCIAESDKVKVGDDPTLPPKVPLIHVQITGVKAEMKLKWNIPKRQKVFANKDITMRWLGVQGGRYVALPPDWVFDNIDKIVSDEALRRGRLHLRSTKEHNGLQEQFVRLPPGDCRTDDPPVYLRNQETGLNYYHQEMIDNCLLGGFVNAIYQIYGETPAQRLLSGWTPTKHKNLQRTRQFVSHIREVLSPLIQRGCVMQRLKEPFTLETNDQMPIVLLLTGNDGSSTHSITCYNGNIYDSASRYVLFKTATALNWCCGKFGYKRTHLAYVLHTEGVSNSKKRRRVTR
jgi:hypothetical protein